MKVEDIPAWIFYVIGVIVFLNFSNVLMTFVMFMRAAWWASAFKTSTVMRLDGNEKDVNEAHRKIREHDARVLDHEVRIIKMEQQ